MDNYRFTNSSFLILDKFGFTNNCLNCVPYCIFSADFEHICGGVRTRHAKGRIPNVGNRGFEKLPKVVRLHDIQKVDDIKIVRKTTEIVRKLTKSCANRPILKKCRFVLPVIGTYNPLVKYSRLLL